MIGCCLFSSFNHQVKVFLECNEVLLMFNLVGQDLKDDVIGDGVCFPRQSQEFVIDPDGTLLPLYVLVKYN